MDNKYSNSKHYMAIADSCGGTISAIKPKEPAVVEQAIDRLRSVVNENRMLSQEIACNVFHNRLSNEKDNGPEPVVLPGMIDDISDKIVQTNDLLSEIKNCLKGQLGEIKLG